MRKEEVASLIVYLLMIALAVIVGLSVVTNTMSVCRPDTINPFLFVIIVIIVGLLFNIIMLEVLHAIGGKLGGYKIASINILGFCFEKREGKWKFKFKDFDGLTGETKLAPKKEKLSMKPFVWLPLFGYAAELAGCIVLHSHMMSDSASNVRWLGVCAILFIVLSSMLALYNLVPIKLDTMTDGYKLVLISKPANIEAYNEMLRAEDLERNGQPVPEMKIFEEITEFTASINLFSVYRHLENNELDEAKKILDITLKDPKKLEPSTYYRLISQKLYIVILTKDNEDAKKVYDEIADDKIRRFIANDASMESIRAYLLISGILEKSQAEVKYAINRKGKALKRTNKQKAMIEEKLYDIALNKVYEAHPKWKEEEKENIAA
ncbi:MAG: hypothetical protein KBS97_00715 [Firmicutes bacterium]|nr:hypothetical protein [Candidatus Fiminaster equi]